MNSLDSNVTALNGVRFTPEMLETMRFWYHNANVPQDMIAGLVDVQGFLIDSLDEFAVGKRDELVEYLQRTRFIITMLKPFEKGGKS